MSDGINDFEKENKEEKKDAQVEKKEARILDIKKLEAQLKDLQDLQEKIEQEYYILIGRSRMVTDQINFLKENK